MIHQIQQYQNAASGTSGNYCIEPIEEKDIDYIIDMCVKLFTDATDYEYQGLYFYILTDFSISKKAVLNGKTIGVYLLNEDSINSYSMSPKENLDLYRTRSGLQGVALGMEKEYRGMGLGRRLRDSILSRSDYDYIWGLQGKKLNNLGNWLNYGRRLVGETDGNYVTLMDLPVTARMIA